MTIFAMSYILRLQNTTDLLDVSHSYVARLLNEGSSRRRSTNKYCCLGVLTSQDTASGAGCSDFRGSGSLAERYKGCFALPRASMVCFQVRCREGCVPMQRFRFSQSKGLRAAQPNGKVSCTPGSRFVARINDGGCNALVIVAQAVAPTSWIRCIRAQFVARGVGQVQCNECTRGDHRIPTIHRLTLRVGKEEAPSLFSVSGGSQRAAITPAGAGSGTSRRGSCRWWTPVARPRR